MKEQQQITDRYVPRPIEDITDIFRGTNDQRPAPMAPDVETVFHPRPSEKRAPKRGRKC